MERSLDSCILASVQDFLGVFIIISTTIRLLHLLFKETHQYSGKFGRLRQALHAMGEATVPVVVLENEINVNLD